MQQNPQQVMQVNGKTIDALSCLRSILFQIKNVRLFLKFPVFFIISLNITKWCFG